MVKRAQKLIVWFAVFGLLLTPMPATAIEIGTNDVRISSAGPDGNVNYAARFSAVAYNSQNDEYFVVWSGEDDSGTLVDNEFEIWGQRITAATGALIGTPIRISDMGPDGDATFSANTPAVAYNSANNEYLVVWSGEDNTAPLVVDEFEIFGQRLNAETGAEVGTNDFRISSMGPDGDTNYSATSPDVVYNSAAGEYLVVWEGDDNTAPLVDEEREIFGQRLTAATGAEVGTDDFRISDMGTDGSGNFDALEPAVAFGTSANGYLVVWRGDDNTGTLVDDEFEVFGQRLASADASAIGTNDFRLSDMGPDGDTNYGAQSVDVAYNSTNGEFLVVWHGDDNTGTLVDDELEAFAQRVTAATGAEIGTNDFRVSSLGTDGDNTLTVLSVAVAYNSISNRYMVTFVGDSDQGGLVDDEFEVYGQLLVGNTGAEVGNDDERLSDMGGTGDANFDANFPAVAASSRDDYFFTTWDGDDDTAPLVDGELEVFGQLFAVSSADLSISTAETDDPAPLNGTFSYVHMVSNGGPDTALNVVVTQVLPASVSFVSGDGIGWTCSAATTTVTCSNPSIASGVNSFLLVEVRPNALANISSTSTVSSASFDNDNTDDSSTEMTQIETDTDGDGLANSVDTDDDGDGISDVNEATLGTDPLDSDTDDDGVSDGQEQTDGSNPLDVGSVVQQLSTSFCSEWNGFLGGLWNINEYVNLAGSTRTVEAIIYDINGSPKSINEVSVLAGAQTDLLVHDMFGWTQNSYGKVCTTVTNGMAGDIDGRMVFYKPVDNTFDFAFSMPFQNGLKGSQFVAFNTFQPSLDTADAANLVTNWVQVTNLESSEQTGTLFYYAQDGTTLGSEAVTLADGARRDFSGHQFGASRVGLIEWRPTNANASFQMRNVRYYYDNSGAQDRFDSAFQLEGLKGSGQLLAVPLDTRSQTAVVEVLNTTNAAQVVNVKIYDAAGTEVSSQDVNLPAFGSQHIIADTLLVNSLGMATVDGATAGGVVAVAMQYGRTQSGGIQFVYGILGREALGTAMRGSYNTFLGQGCTLVVVNPTATAETVTIGMTRFDGTAVLTGGTLAVPARGAASTDLCTQELDNNYGVVTVQPTVSNSVVAHIVRLGENDAYRFPTPVRQ